jgi:lipopolysaccharide heptosyltransferase II
MNILIITTHLNFGGIASYTVSLARALSKRGHNVTVASSSGGMLDELKLTGARHILINIDTKSELSPKILTSLSKLIKIFKKEKFDIIHAQTRVTQVLAFLLSKFTDVPFVSTCHGFFRPHWGRKLFGFWGSNVIAISEAVKRYLIEKMGVDAGRVCLIYNGLDIDRFSKDFTSREKVESKENLGLKNEPVVGCVCRLSHVKGVQYLLVAMQRILERLPRAQLLIVGGGNYKEDLVGLARRLGIQENVFFHPPLGDISSVFAAMDVFCLPSLQEGLGLAIMEAMAWGLPVVATCTGGISDLIEDGIDGLLVRPKDPEALAGAILELLCDEKKAREFGIKAKASISRKFSLEKMVTKVEDLYSRVIAEKGPRRILVINVNWLGDVLLSTVALAALRESFPDSYIACMLQRRCLEILEGNPDIDELIAYDQEGRHRSVLAKLRLLRFLRKKSFTEAVLFHRSFTRLLLAYLSGIPKRAGYYTRKRGFLLTIKVFPQSKPIHRAEYYLDVVRSLGSIDDKDRFYRFFISEKDRKDIEKFLAQREIKEGDFLVAINPGANWLPKRWPHENFARLCDRLLEKYQAKVIITGAKKDAELARRISSLSGARPIIACGLTSLKQLGALFQRSSLVISGDSGPMHIAAAVGANLIALFGPTSPSVTGPYGRGNYRILRKDVGCKIPCYEVNCRDNLCMKAITVEDVMREVERFKDG